MVRDPVGVGVHFLHVGKTGGNSMKSMVRERKLDTTADGRRLMMHRHAITLFDVLSWNRANTAAFFLREPAARFVSGFNSRLREGAPEKSIPWTPFERLAFKTFPTPNDLAEGLSAKRPMLQDKAFAAMNAMVHSRMRYSYWFRDVGYLESRIDRIAFIGFQEHYAEDAARFLTMLGAEATAPAVEHRHRAPTTLSTELSVAGRDNVLRWYADDTAIYEWALAHRDRWAPADGAPADV